MLDTGVSRREQLHSLLDILAEKINSYPGARDLAQLCKQYRETLQEIEEIEGNEPEEDEIAKLLGESNGVPGPVRKNNAEV